MRAVPLLAALALAAPPAPAHAAQGYVYGNFGVFPVPAGGAYLAVVECNATAFLGDSVDVPITSMIECSVGGVERRAVGVGPVAATAFVSIAARTFEICVYAEATFFDLTVNSAYTVHHDRYCVPVELE